MRKHVSFLARTFEAESRLARFEKPEHLRQRFGIDDVRTLRKPFNCALTDAFFFTRCLNNTVSSIADMKDLSQSDHRPDMSGCDSHTSSCDNLYMHNTSQTSITPQDISLVSLSADEPILSPANQIPSSVKIDSLETDSELLLKASSSGSLNDSDDLSRVPMNNR